MTKPADIGTNADIVRIRLESAAEKLNEALTLYQSAAKNHLSYNGSISRSYYAIFKTISAVHALDNISYKRHKDAIVNFNKLYIKTGIFPRDFGRKIHQAFTRRNNSDYDDFYIADADESLEQYEFAKEFLATITAYCQERMK